MAVTKHVPAEPAVRTPLDSLQLDAVPRETAYVIAPLSVPPEVVSVRADPNVPLVEVRVSVA